MEQTDMKWRTLAGAPIDQPIKERVEEIIQREVANGYRLKVCIGTDSQVYGQVVEYGTVIVFLREGHGGFMLISNDRRTENISIKERMLAEVARSIQIAYDICDLLNRYNVELEVHADINTDPQFKSNKALSEAMGYIMSMGFAFKAKPDAIAASNCANKVV
jgi:hypothetical protein